MTRAIEHADQLTDHWWWRPGFPAGRHFTFGDRPDLRKLSPNVRPGAVLRPAEPADAVVAVLDAVPEAMPLIFGNADPVEPLRPGGVA